MQDPYPDLGDSEKWNASYNYSNIKHLYPPNPKPNEEKSRRIKPNDNYGQNEIELRLKRFIIPDRERFIPGLTPPFSNPEDDSGKWQDLYDLYKNKYLCIYADKEPGRTRRKLNHVIIMVIKRTN